jgi:hypothetical protein
MAGQTQPLMEHPTAQQITALKQSGQFDADWYRARHPDVESTGMEPAEHYLLYGHRMNRDPGPGFSNRFARIAYGIKDEHEPLARLEWMRSRAKGAPVLPNSKRVLMAANRVAQAGDHPRAIALAEEHLPADLAYTAEILRANAAIARADEDAWLSHVNAYLAHFNAPLIRLQGAGSVFDRLACDPLPHVTGGPLVSVIMPAWNAEATVRKAAQSILDQTWRNLELLIVDDASTDGTWAVLQQIAAADTRVKIARNAINVGPYVSKNIALTRAKGEWITGHDADDWAVPLRLEQHVGRALRGSAKVSLTYMLRMVPYGAFERFTPIGNFSFDGASRVASISALFDADWMQEKLGFWDSVRFAADSEMIARAKLIANDGFMEYRSIGMICLDSPEGLTNDPETGISTANGLSKERVTYKNSWSNFHGLASEDRLFVHFPLLSPKFGTETRHFVPSDDVLKAMSNDDFLK